MDKIGYNHNKLVVFDTNVTQNKWLTWLICFFEMTKVIKVIKVVSWHGIIHFI
jgi:hypothetical protein